MKNPRRASHGFTLVELSMVSVVLLVMSAVIVQSIRQMSLAESTMREQTKITSLAERVLASVENDVSHTMRAFTENATGREHLAKLDTQSILRSGETMLAGSRMPVATMLGTFDPDPADAVQTGNLLLLVRKDGTVTVDSSVDATPRLRRIDVMRFVVWFLHPGEVTGVDLARWSSVRLARLADLEAIADADSRAATVGRLRALGIEFAWDARAAAAGAFHHLRTDGSIELFAADGSELVPADPSACEPAIFAVRHVGVAANGRLPTPVPAFARPTATFPHGFELKRDGDGSGDLMLMRLVIANRDSVARTRVGAEIVRQVAFRSE